MRFLHVSDTHVGYSAYHKVNAAGLNQREQDFFDAFARAVDLALAERVDAVLHSGDLFDSVRPTNRAVAFAMEQVKRLGEAGVPLVVIAGNHETPKLRETGSVFRFLEFLPLTFPVFKGRYEKVRLGDVAFHCVPHAASEEALREELDGVEKDSDARFNVLTFHAGVAGVGDFRTGEFNEHTVAASYVRREMDYVGLGHYHKPTQVAPNAWYAGSTERCSFKEADEPKGALLVDLARGTVEFRDLGARPMVTLPTIACRGMPAEDVPAELYRRIGEADLAGKIARIRLRDCPRHAYAAIDFREVRRLAEPALHFHAAYDLATGAEGSGESEGPIGALASEFEAFVTRVPLEGLDRARLVAKGIELLDAAGGGPRA